MNNNRFYCSECKHNETHATDACFILKNRKKRAEQAAMHGKGDDNQKSCPFSKCMFRKKVNTRTRKASKKDVLSLVAKMVKHDQAKTA